MEGRILLTICLILMGLMSFSTATSPAEDPTVTSSWCQPPCGPKKMTPTSDARTKECCGKVDKTLGATMGLFKIVTPTGEQDANEQEITVTEMKPTCFFKTSDSKHAESFGKCCNDAQLTMRGAGPASSSATVDEATLDKCFEELRKQKS
jgi:hypothetical protein